MHFTDDWEEEGDVWDDYFTDVKVESPMDVAHHHRTFAVVEDAFNVRSKAAVILAAAKAADAAASVAAILYLSTAAFFSHTATTAQLT